MSALTKLAKGRMCTIRIPFGCDGGGPTTVPCHFRSQRIGAGMGIKPPDLFCAFGCHFCHDVVDGRKRIAELSKEEIREYHLMGVLETQKWLWDAGYIHFGKQKEAA